MSDPSSQTVPIVMFHDIGLPGLRTKYRGMTVPFPLFGLYVRAMDRDGWRGISMRELADRWERGTPLPSKTLVFTFDDAYVGVYRHALPVMERRGWSATIYVVSEQIGGRNAWMEDREGERPLMTALQLRDAASRGFEIGAHTQNHPFLTQISLDHAEREIRASKASIEDCIGLEVPSFAYPYGDHNEAVKRLAQDAGFRSAVSVLPGLATSESDRFALPRVPVVSWRLSPAKFRALIDESKAA